VLRLIDGSEEIGDYRMGKKDGWFRFRRNGKEVRNLYQNG